MVRYSEDERRETVIKHIKNGAVSEYHHCYNVATFPSLFQTKYLQDVS
jgi:hypothetical protein